jgi:alcohol oxidase
LYAKLASQAETYQEEFTNDTHGTEGPIKVSFAKEHTNVAVNFLEVAGAYDKARELTDDVNAFTSCNQYGVSNTFVESYTLLINPSPEMGEVCVAIGAPDHTCSLTKFRYIDIKTGKRSDTAHNYIYNQSHNANLTVMDESRVIRVIFEYGPRLI